jgi:hypothetical protein
MDPWRPSREPVRELPEDRGGTAEEAGGDGANYMPERMEFVKISRLSKSLAIRLYRSASLRCMSFIMS